MRQLGAVKDATGAIVTRISDILTTVTDAWQTLFSKKHMVPFDTFYSHVQHLIENIPCEVPSLTGQTIQKQILGVKNRRATAMDGWGIRELKRLPMPFFQQVAGFFQLIEDDSLSWPDVCTEVVTSIVPKEATIDARTFSDFAIVAGDGLATRPISNLSPLYSAYASCRYSDIHMAPWRELWMSPNMYGARKNCSVHDASPGHYHFA